MSTPDGAVGWPGPHSIYGYRKGCRCEVCRTANWAAQQRWRAKILQQPIPNRVHGTLNGYMIYGCRCPSCRQAHRENRAQLRVKRRRIRRLVAAGLPYDHEGPI